MNDQKDLSIQNSSLGAPAPFSRSPMAVNPQLLALEGAMDLTKESMRCFTDYMKYRENEITERKKIQACLNAVVEKITAQKDAYIKTLELHATERMHLYDKADAVLQHALQMNDIDMVKITYNYILTVYNKSENTLDKSLQCLDDQNVIAFLK